MALSIKQVRYFIAAADAGQVSQAAIELNVSQSAITAAIKQLEGDLAVRLFDRQSTGVALTAEGTRFLQHARIIMAAVNEAMSAPLTEDMAHAGHVRIGVTYTVAGYFMPRHYARFLRSYPRISVELRELPREAIEEGLVDGALDIAVVLVSNLAETDPHRIRNIAAVAAAVVAAGRASVAQSRECHARRCGEGILCDAHGR